MEVLVAQLVVYKLCIPGSLNCVEIHEMQCKKPAATVDLTIASNVGIKLYLI